MSIGSEASPYDRQQLWDKGVSGSKQLEEDHPDACSFSFIDP